MSLTIKIIIISGILVLFIVVTMFPGWFPIRAFETVFYSSCQNVLGGEVNKIENMEFVGLGGAPVRQDYLECGVEPAIDANRICYVKPSSNLLDENPLGSSRNNDCDRCQFGSEDVKYGKKILGEKCRPYKHIWRWIYKSAF